MPESFLLPSECGQCPIHALNGNGQTPPWMIPQCSSLYSECRLSWTLTRIFFGAAHRYWSVSDWIINLDWSESSLEVPHLLFVQNPRGYFKDKWTESPVELSTDFSQFVSSILKREWPGSSLEAPTSFSFNHYLGALAIHGQSLLWSSKPSLVSS